MGRKERQQWERNSVYPGQWLGIPWCQITLLFPVSTLAFFEVPLLEPEEQGERLECLVLKPCRNSFQPG